MITARLIHWLEEKWRSAIRYAFVGMLTVSAVSAGQPPSPAEAKLVGSWVFASLDSTLTLTYERNHTFSQSVWTGGERFVECSGVWRVEGNDIVRDIKWSIFDKLKTLDLDATKPPSQIRETIDRLDRRTLAIKKGITYERGKRPPKPTSWREGRTKGIK